MELGKVKVTPRFFSKDFPGEEPMEMELYRSWDVATSKPAEAMNLFFVKAGKSRQRMRVYLTKAEAKTLGTELLRMAEQS